MKIESIEMWQHDKAIVRDSEDQQYVIKDVEGFENVLKDTIQIDHQDLDFIHHLGFGEFAREKYEELQDYINLMNKMDDSIFGKFLKKLESDYDKMLRITFYRNDLVMRKNDLSRSDEYGKDRKINQYRKRLSLLDYCISTLTK